MSSSALPSRSTHPFRSQHLIYRAVEPKEDLDFYHTLASDAEGQLMASSGLPRPESKETQEAFIKRVKDAFLHVVICIPHPATTLTPSPSTTTSPPIPIGTMGVWADTSIASGHHRNVGIGIRILKEYRGQGHGSEAIEWAVDWAFRRAGMHKVKIAYLEFNARVGKLYERLGFVREGVLRKEVWGDGKWWDKIEMGMLDDEFWERERKRKGEEMERDE